jgi:hypothetical protein
MRTLLCVLVSFPYAALAEDSICGVVIENQAYDLTSLETHVDIAMKAKEDLCSKEYSDVGEAQSKAKSSGFNLGYSGFEIGASEAKQQTSGKWSIRDTSFCKASENEFKNSASSSFSKQVASIAVGAWLDCIKSTDTNQLFLKYEVINDGKTIIGSINSRIVNGSTDRKITAIQATGVAASGFTCQIGGQIVQSGVQATPIDLDSTEVGFACEKSTDDGLAFQFVTSVTSMPWIVLPSPAAAEAKALTDLSAELESAKKAIFDGDQRFVAMESRLTELQTINDRISSLSATFDKFGRSTLYRCPVDVTSGDAKWLSVGCIGQISTLGTCTNWWWAGGVQTTQRQCDPIEVWIPQ